MSQAAAIAIRTVPSILLVFDIVGNSLVCVIMKRNRDMRSPINYLLLNLAIADIIYATFITPSTFFKLTFNHPEGVTGKVFCKLLTGGTVAWVGAASSIFTLAAIAIERYYAVMYPHGNKGRLTKRKLKLVIPVSWIFALILNTPLFLVFNFDKKINSCMGMWPKKWMSQAFPLTWEIMVVIIMALMVMLYSKVVYTLWIKRNDDSQLTHQEIGVMRVRKRVTLMVVTVSVIFGICWGTDVAVYVLKAIASYDMGPVPVAIANTMVLFNSAVNPFVYALFNHQFREKMKRMLCCTSFSASKVNPTPDGRGWSLSTIQPPTYPTGQDHFRSKVAVTASQLESDISLYEFLSTS